MFIALFYKLSHRGTSYSVSYVQSLVAFVMITTIVIMVIGNNLARAFGLVGSMSIIRFRMAIKDTRDIVFIFLALAIGMSCGVGQYTVAVVSSIFIGTLVLVLSSFQFGSPNKREYLLQFFYAARESGKEHYLPVLERFLKKIKLINIKSAGDAVQEMSYYVTLRRGIEPHQMIGELEKIEGVTNINFFYDEE